MRRQQGLQRFPEWEGDSGGAFYMALCPAAERRLCRGRPSWQRLLLKGEVVNVAIKCPRCKAINQITNKKEKAA